MIVFVPDCNIEQISVCKIRLFFDYCSSVFMAELKMHVFSVCDNLLTVYL